MINIINRSFVGLMVSLSLITCSPLQASPTSYEHRYNCNRSQTVTLDSPAPFFSKFGNEGELKNTPPKYGYLSAEELAARLLMIELSSTELSETEREFIGAHPWNGVILFVKNVKDEEQTRKFITSIHEAMKVTPLISIDQEGGNVDHFRFPSMSLSPGLLALGKLEDGKAVYDAHRIMGQELRDLGIHIDFAPCLDVNTNPDNPIIGVRSLGEDPQCVAKLGRHAIRGLRQGGVAVTAKHFPGHGNTNFDTHLSLASLDTDMEELESTELIPFKAAIEENIDAIMTTHVVFRALDETSPATLSKKVLTELLRHKMGFKGVIVTDSMAMRAISDNFGAGEATVRAIEAGADIVLALGGREKQEQALKALTEAIRSGRISRQRVAESLLRIEEIQKKFHYYPQEYTTWNIENNRKTMQNITDKTVAILSNKDNLLPLKDDPNDKLLVIAPSNLPQTPYSDNDPAPSWSERLAPHYSNVEECAYKINDPNLDIAETAEKAKKFKRVALFLYARGRLAERDLLLAKEVLASNPSTIVVPLACPYILNSLPPVRNCITAYNYGEMSLDSLWKKMFTR